MEASRKGPSAPGWLELCTVAEREAVDSVAEVFSRWGHGVAIEEPLAADQEPEEPPKIDPAAPVQVKTYLPAVQSSEEARRQIEEALWHLGRIRFVGPLQVRQIAEEDWAHAWERFFHVHRPSERIVIVPTWRRYRPRHGDLVIRLDPGMAFGTGLHPTTRLCLRELERLVAPGCRVLDLGTGSGILAIAAVRLGAGAVLALDIDPIAVAVARHNVRRNRVARQVEVEAGTLPWSGKGLPCDLLVANISYRALSGLCGCLAGAIVPAGRALLSGVLERDAPALIEQLRIAGWELVRMSQEGDWVALVVVPSAGEKGPSCSSV